MYAISKPPQSMHRIYHAQSLSFASQCGEALPQLYSAAAFGNTVGAVIQMNSQVGN